MAYHREKVVTVTVTEKDFINNDNVCYGTFLCGESNYIISVIHDRDSESPREWDTLFTWVTTSRAGYSDRKMDTPDKYTDSNGELPGDFLSAHLVVPLHLYRHSGDHISVGETGDAPGTNCMFDGGVMGFAYAKWKDVENTYPQETDRKALQEKAVERLQSEVDAMNAYLNDQVYGYEMYDMDTEKSVESGYGFLCCDRKDLEAFVVDAVEPYINGGYTAAVQFAKEI